MTEELQQFAGAVYDLRWIIVVAALATLGAWVADLTARLRGAVRWIDELEDENHKLRANARPPVVALPPRQNGESRG